MLDGSSEFDMKKNIYYSQYYFTKIRNYARPVSPLCTSDILHELFPFSGKFNSQPEK